MDRMARLLTVADLLSDPGYEHGELWDGRFVVREPSGGPHGSVEASVVFALRGRDDIRDFGRVMGASTGYVVARDPDRVLSPDVSLLSFDRCATLPARGFIPGAPDLAVEIRSPQDTWLSVVEKGGVWIGHGARLVWCIDPAARSVLVLRPGDEPRSVPEGGTLHLAPLLDRALPCHEVFAEL